MFSLSNAAKSKLIELVPVLITIARYPGKGTIYPRLFFEHVLIIPPLYKFLVNDIADVLQFAMVFTVSSIALHSFYEIFFILNDTWTVKREDRPTLRSYVRNINSRFAVTARALYFLAMTYLLITNIGIPLSRIVISTAILLIEVLIHNLQQITLKRIATYHSLRTIRLLYIPSLLLGITSPEMRIMLIVLLPYLFTDAIGYHWGLLNKVNKIPFVHTPAYLWHGSFLFLQIPLVWPHVTCLAGNLAIILLSLAKNHLVGSKK